MAVLDTRAEVINAWERFQEKPKANRLKLRLTPQRPTRIVCLGGGTGLPAVLRGLALYADPRNGPPGVELSAVVAMSDDGGSSGRLRRGRGALPPGDIRNCLVALASEKGPLTEALQHRFDGKTGLGGHALGNLLITALTELKGDFLEAVRLTGKILDVRGTVLPSTLVPVELVAEMVDARRLVGESNICRSHGRVKRVQLHPRRPPATDGVLEAIEEADLITLGPGSLYSSILPNLLVDGVADALKSSRALKVMVANLMTQPGETDGMGCLEHVKALQEHVGGVIDVVLLNGTSPSEGAVERYAKQGSRVVAPDPEALRALGLLPVVADLIKVGPRIRHDSVKLARCLLNLARTGV